VQPLPPAAPGRELFYGWIVLAASVAIIAVGIGTIFSLAVFLRPLEDEFGWTRSLISGIAFVNWLIVGIGSFVAGVLSDRIGTRRVVGAGAALMGAALLVSSQVRSAAQLYLTFGVLGALGASAFYVPLSASATRWFTARRGLAMGIISSGMGLGIFVVPPSARALITALGWRPTFAVFGGITWAVAAIALRYLADRPEDRGLRSYGADDDRRAARGPASAMTPRDALRHPVFWGVALVHLGCCAAHSGPIYHMVAHAMDLGVPRMAAASMLGLSGATSIAGRLSSGALADRLGAKTALVAMLTFQAATLSTYLYAGGTVSLFGAALAFGAAYGGAMPLYALVAREYFGERVVGTTFGGIFFVSCIGMGAGAYGGGLLFDHLGTYWTLHLGSTLIGASAVAVALALHPPTRATAGAAAV
jgi:predicted MFS family arabinose efflux permease